MLLCDVSPPMAPCKMIGPQLFGLVLDDAQSLLEVAHIVI